MLLFLGDPILRPTIPSHLLLFLGHRGKPSVQASALKVYQASALKV